MSKARICCCVPGAWAKTIGWLQYLLTAAAILQLVPALFSVSGTSSNNEVVESQTQKDKPILGLIITLVFMSFIMSVVLLRGCYNRNARLIHAWMVFTVMCMASLVVVTLVALLIESDAHLIFSVVFWLSTQEVCFWVVSIHKKEIETEAQIQSSMKIQI